MIFQKLKWFYKYHKKNFFSSIHKYIKFYKTKNNNIFIKIIIAMVGHSR